MKSQLEKLPINVFFNILPFLESKDIENLHVVSIKYTTFEKKANDSNSFFFFFNRRLNQNKMMLKQNHLQVPLPVLLYLLFIMM